MKLLLDENLPHDLRHFLPGHEVFTVAYMNWHGMKNGRLLNLASRSGFDALLTLDAGIPYQQNLRDLPCAVVIIKAESNKLTDLQGILTKLLNSLSSLQPKAMVVVA